jgi:hypothetical protein
MMTVGSYRSSRLGAVGSVPASRMRPGVPLQWTSAYNVKVWPEDPLELAHSRTTATSASSTSYSSEPRPSALHQTEAALAAATRSTHGRPGCRLPRRCHVVRQAELASALPMTLAPCVAFGSSPMLARSARPSSDPDRSLDEATSCSQSQIGQDRYLGSWWRAQVEAAVALSVAVRS